MGNPRINQNAEILEESGRGDWSLEKKERKILFFQILEKKERKRERE